MKLTYTSIELTTLAPLHHGYTEAKKYNDGGHKKTYRLVRQIKLMTQDNSDDGETYRQITVPVLGGNALRGRLRRALAYETMKIIGVYDALTQGKKPSESTKMAFHTLTSGGTLKAKGSKDEKSNWTAFPVYRDRRVAEWPLLSLMGFSMADFMVRSKLRVSFGWPLINAIQPIVSIPADAAYELFPAQWRGIEPADLIMGSQWHSEDLHYEYRHADKHVMEMPAASEESDKDNESGGAVLGYQYVPAGVPFGFRLTGQDLTNLEASALRMAIESAFPLGQPGELTQPIVWGGRSASGMGLMQVDRANGLGNLPSSDEYRAYLVANKEMLTEQIMGDKFLTNVEDLATFGVRPETKKQKSAREKAEKEAAKKIATAETVELVTDTPEEEPDEMDDEAEEES